MASLWSSRGGGGGGRERDFGSTMEQSDLQSHQKNTNKKNKNKELGGVEVELEYAKLARQVGRLFYARKNQGLHCVLLNLLTKHEWIKEDMLAKQLGLSWRQVRRALRELDKDCLIKRVVLKNTKAPTGTYGSTSDSTQSFCSIDYKGMVDSCRLRMAQLRKYLKGEEDSKVKVEGYVCSDDECKRTYTALEASDLDVDPRTFMFLCEFCDSVLKESGGGGSNRGDEKQKQKEIVKKQLALFDEELKPFADLLKRLKPYNPPYFGTLQEWATVQAKIRKGESIEENEQEDFVIEFDDAGDGDENGLVSLEPKVKAKELPPWMRLGYQPESKPAATSETAAAASPSNQDNDIENNTNTTTTTAKRPLQDDEGSDEQQAKRARVEEENEREKAEEKPAVEPDEEDDDVEWEDI